MDLKRDFEEIKNKIDNESQAERQADAEYIKAKVSSEAHETALIIQDPTKALNTKLNMKVAEHIDNSQAVAEKISTTADKLVDKGLKAQENKADAQVIESEDATIEADFKKHEAEYLYHGIDHKVDKKWKQNLLLRINDVWFVIWAIVSCFTIVPVSTFLSRIKALKGIVKSVAVVIGIILLLACLAGITMLILKSCGVFG